MQIESGTLTEWLPVTTQPDAKSSPRGTIVAIASSLLLHGGFLAACVYVSESVVSLTQLRRGHSTQPMQLVMSLSPAVPPEPIKMTFRAAELGTSEFDRLARELAEHRGIEQRRRTSSAVLTPIDAPQPQPSVVELPRYQPRTETLDELRPTSIEVEERPRRHRLHPPTPTTLPSATPSALQQGTESWIPEPMSTNDPPQYPAEAIGVRAEGTTQLRVTVLRDGSVVDVAIKESSGWASLDQAAADAVSQWRFRPQSSRLAMKSQTVVIPITFQFNR